MKKLINIFAGISLLALLIGVPTGCQKEEFASQNRYVHFYYDGIEMTNHNSNLISGLLGGSVRSTYYVEKDYVTLAAKVGSVSPQYDLEIRFPLPKISEVYENPSLIRFAEYSQKLEIKKARFSIEELKYKRSFNGFKRENGSIKIAYTYHRVFISGTFEFEGISREGEYFSVTGGEFASAGGCSNQ